MAESNAHSDVKSTSLVKYSNLKAPAKFCQLQANTNLNPPPSNWLKGASKVEQNLSEWTKPKEDSEFTSFRLANIFSDAVGQVDLISDAENIKTLLKMPFDKHAQVSVIVHRIGETLLLDEFDIQKHLLRIQKTEWRWFKKFFFDHILAEYDRKGNQILKRATTRDELIKKNLDSKFLHYRYTGGLKWTRSRDTCCSVDGDVPRGSEETPEGHDSWKDQHRDSSTPAVFQRNVLWTFEDIQMMIGTNLPIFGDNKHPAVSLRLRDMRKPITILTGLDFWLDNLMCNVPELAMCYHLDGIVQSYELIKTEDIPKLEHSNFSPEVIRNVAQNILSFFKRNATKEGHTYWLFKAADDDIVKLYDLSCLCPDLIEDQTQNPYTLPVGMLLYRVATNMMQKGRERDAATIHALLGNALKIIDQVKCAEVYSSACVHMAKLFLDIASKEVSPAPKTTESQSSRIHGEDASTSFVSMSIDSLGEESPIFCENDPPHSPRLEMTPEEGYRESLRFAMMGMEHLLSTQSVDGLVEEMPKPEERGQRMFLHSSFPWKKHNWQQFVQFSRKSTIALADLLYQQGRWGKALRMAAYAARFDMSAASGCLQAHFLQVCGDIHGQLARTYAEWERQAEQYDECNPVMLKIFKFLSQREESEEDIPTEYEWAVRFLHDIEANLTVSVRAYQEALSKDDVDEAKMELLRKRHGNSLNELGSFYMHKATATMSVQGDACDETSLHPIWKQSFACFERGIDVFQSTHDNVNVALLTANCGRLMRGFARSMSSSDGKLQAKECDAYKKAIEYYQKALDLLGKANKSKRLRAVSPTGVNVSELKESVTWELSTTYFTLACLLQEATPLELMERDQVEKTIADYMNRAVQVLDLQASSARLPIYQYRAATAHHRLASMYHNLLRDSANEHRSKQLRLLAESHYQKAKHHFVPDEHPLEFLRIQLEQVALCEFLMQGAPLRATKNLIDALDHLVACLPALVAIQRRFKEADSEAEAFEKEALKLTQLFIARLQFTLLGLNKALSSLKKKSKEDTVKQLKADYASSLRLAVGAADKSVDPLIDFVSALVQTSSILKTH